MTNRKNPHFTEVRRQNIKDLLGRLKGKNPLTNEVVDKILARFAIERGIRVERAEEYYRTLKTAGLI